MVLQNRGHGGGRCAAADVANGALGLGLYLIIVFVTAFLEIVLVDLFHDIGIVLCILFLVLGVTSSNLGDSTYV